MSEWISVRERLPEVGQEVLVYWRNTSQKAEHFELTHYTGAVSYTHLTLPTKLEV